jgi:prepilin-type N-terminal cleavage/methylation domain-containing protein
MQASQYHQPGMTRTTKDGFTLIELAIVLTITGLLIGASLPLIKIWMAYKREGITKEHIQDIREAMAQYYARTGALPCPGPRVDLDTPYLFATVCAGIVSTPYKDTAAARGIFFAGATSRQMNAESTAAIIEGGVPYKQLNIARETAFDGWQHLMTYAVTLELTNPMAFDSQGQIKIIDQNGNSIIDPRTPALWVIVSHGSDAAGAYNGFSANPMIPCNKQHADSRNCSHTGIYMAANRSLSDSKTYYDDIIFYRNWVDTPPVPSPGYCNLNNIQGVKHDPSMVVQEGMLVKTCPLSEDCTLLVCHNGALVPGIINLNTLQGP